MSKGRKIGDYKQMTEIGHVIHRMNVYVGSVAPEERIILVLRDGKLLLEKTDILSPALAHIAREFCDNVADNVKQSRICKVEPGMLMVEYLLENRIRITNTGLPFMIAPHDISTKDELLMIPRVNTTMMRTSTNYEEGSSDAIGLNGMGAKIGFFTAKKAKLTCLDADLGQRYSMTYGIVKGESEPRLIKESCEPGYHYAGKKWRPNGRDDSLTENRTSIEWVPDFSLFGVKRYVKLDHEHISAIAVCTAFACAIPVQIQRYNEDPQYFDFSDTDRLNVFSEMLFGEAKTFSCVGSTDYDVKYEIVLADKSREGFTVSLANGALTNNGGIHVNAIVHAIKKIFADKNVKVTDSAIQANIGIFISVAGSNSTFDSQSKQKLINIGSSDRKEKKRAFSTIILAERTINTVAAKLKEFEAYKLLTTLGSSAIIRAEEKKAREKPLDRTQHLPANKLGPGALLLIDEGISAGGYTSHLRSALPGGNNKNGILHLGGKPPNVREMDMVKALEKKVFKYLVNVMNFRHGVDYLEKDSYKTLNYGTIGIITDSDHDGGHIRGLVINTIAYFWPTFLTAGHITIIATPVIRVLKAKKQIASYDSIAEFEAAKDSLPKGIAVKYCKGLASSSNQEAEADAKCLKIMVIAAGNNYEHQLDVVFAKSFIAERKKWMLETKGTELVATKMEEETDTCIYYRRTLRNVLNYDVLNYSRYSLSRAIGGIDGFKDVTRKIMWAMLMNSHVGKMTKVYLLTSLVSGATCYHHGDASLSEAINRMSQDHPCSNNLPLLGNDSQSGCRQYPRDQHGAPRYVSACLTKIASLIMPKDLVAMVPCKLDEDGRKIEPTLLICLLPMAIINGADGMATGWNVKIPPHHPLDVIDYLVELSKFHETGSEVELPYVRVWYRGFTGRIKYDAKTRTETYIDEAGEEVTETFTAGHVAKGVYEREDDEVHITEIPPCVATSHYVSFLQELQTKRLIRDLTDMSKPDTVDIKFTVAKNPPSYKDADGKNVQQSRLEISHKSLRLIKTIGMGNMTVITEDGVPRTVSSVPAYLDEYYDHIVSYIEKRRLLQMQELHDKIAGLEERRRFIKLAIKNVITMRGTRLEFEAQLSAHNFDKEMAKMRFYDINTDSLAEIKAQIADLKMQLRGIEEDNSNAIYRRDLQAIRTYVEPRTL